MQVLADVLYPDNKAAELPTFPAHCKFSFKPWAYENGCLSRLLVVQVDQVTPDVPLPGLKQKGKEAAAIGKGGASGPGAADQVLIRISYVVLPA